MAASQHRNKRHIQTSIASYFDKHTPSEATPELDLETQLDLINVGMRVRKSVPEGYKTHKTLPVAGSRPPQAQSSDQIVPQQYAHRELAPFSGLHKTGGIAQQDSWSLPTPAEDDLPFLTSSQDTVSSAQSYETTRKRSYEEEDDLMLDEMDQEDTLADRIIAQPKPFDRRRRLMEILDKGQDFAEAQFLQPADFDMDEYD